MRYLTVFAVTVLTAALLVSFFPSQADAAVYDGVLRLHVIAASDSAEDQAIKYAVRDALLEASAPILSGCTSRDEAALRMREATEMLRAVAEETVTAYGGTDTAEILLGLEQYPTRTYAAAALPAGEYLSLRVVLGEGEGQNWWCVLFPPLCLGAATAEEAETVCIAAGLTPEQYRIIAGADESPRYRVKFKILEFFGEIFAR